jgi:hypothetical protein
LLCTGQTRSIDDAVIVAAWNTCQLFAVMGIEYRAVCRPDDGWLDHARATLASDPRFAFVNRDPEHLTLRLISHPLHEHWPEDIDVCVDGDGVYVLFHGGTRAERHTFLEILRETLARVGCEAQFEEI